MPKFGQPLAIMLLAVAMSGLICGCDPKDARARTPEEQETDASPAGYKMTDEDRESIGIFASQLEKSVADRDPAFLSKVFEIPVILEKHLANFPLRGEVLSTIRENSELLKRSHLRTFFKGHPRYIRASVRQGQPSALFRFTFNGGFDYLELLLERNHTAEWRITDTYEHSTGESFSYKLFALLMETAKVKDNVFITTILHENPDKANELITALLLTQCRSHLESGRTEEALLKLSKIPDEFASIPEVLLAKIAIYDAAMASSDAPEVWNSAVNDFVTRFPKHTATFILQYVSALKNQDIAGAHTALDNLNANINADPFLEFQHAYLWKIENDLEKAMKTATDFLKSEPSNELAWVVVFQIAVESQNYEIANKALSYLSRRPDFDHFALKEDPRYAPFFNSPQGQTWR